MLIEGVDGGLERQMLIASITRSDFLARIRDRAGSEPHRSRWGNLLHSWCRNYHTKYSKAPGRTIETLFRAWATNDQVDKDIKKTLNRFLGSLSEEYAQQKEPLELGYLLDLAESYFNQVLLERQQEEIKQALSKNNTRQALQLQQSFRKVELQSPPAVNILSDRKAQKRALLEKQRILIHYPGPAGDFFGNELAEDSFVAFMAQSKGGKSFGLLDVAWRGMQQGNKVAYFQVGDLSQNQILRRFQIRAARRPLEPRTIRYPIGIALPIERKSIALIEHKEITYEKELSWPTGRKAYEKVLGKTKGDLRLSYHPIKTVSVADIKHVLESWDKDGWIAKVVVVDYAGNLAAVDNKLSPHEQTAHSWAMLRQISELRNCLVVTANQSNAKGFSSWVLSRNHFADSKMILAHVTAFAGINMTDEEKERGLLRYNWIVRREAEFSETNCLYLGHCLSIANPCVVSAFQGV